MIFGAHLELPEGVPGPRWLGHWCHRLEGTWTTHQEREFHPKACTTIRQAREVSHPFRPRKTSLTGVVTLRTPGCLNLYHDATKWTGGSRSATLRQGGTWAPPRGSLLTLEELFPSGSRWRAWALAETERQFQARLSAGESWLMPNWKARLPRSFDPERFHLTEMRPVIYFPLYSTAPYAEGILAFSLAISGRKENTPEGRLFSCIFYLVSPVATTLQ